MQKIISTAQASSSSSTKSYSAPSAPVMAHSSGNLNSSHMPAVPSGSSSGTSRDDVARAFNTALIATQAKSKRDFSGELLEITESAPFKAILSAVRQLASIHGMTERQAAEQVIQTFRKIDEVWSDYVFREGLDKIRGGRR